MQAVRLISHQLFQASLSPSVHLLSGVFDSRYITSTACGTHLPQSSTQAQNFSRQSSLLFIISQTGRMEDSPVSGLPSLLPQLCWHGRSCPCPCLPWYPLPLSFRHVIFAHDYVYAAFLCSALLRPLKLLSLFLKLHTVHMWASKFSTFWLVWYGGGDSLLFGLVSAPNVSNKLCYSLIVQGQLVHVQLVNNTEYIWYIQYLIHTIRTIHMIQYIQYISYVRNIQYVQHYFIFLLQKLNIFKFKDSFAL